MQTTSAVWCQEPRPAVETAAAAMTSAQSAARLSLEVTPGARLLIPSRTLRRRAVSPRLELAGKSGTKEERTDGGGAASLGATSVTSADESRSSAADGAGTSTSERRLDGGEFWHELVFIE